MVAVPALHVPLGLGVALGPTILSRGGILPAGVAQDHSPSPPALGHLPRAARSRALSGTWGSRGRDERYREPERSRRERREEAAGPSLTQRRAAEQATAWAPWARVPAIPPPPRFLLARLRARGSTCVVHPPGVTGSGTPREGARAEGGAGARATGGGGERSLRGGGSPAAGRERRGRRGRRRRRGPARRGRAAGHVRPQAPVAAAVPGLSRARVFRTVRQ